MSQAAASTTHFWLKREAVPLTLEAVAVNVSMDNLASLAVPSVVAELASSAGVAPQSVVLEVTGSRLMSDLRAPMETC